MENVKSDQEIELEMLDDQIANMEFALIQKYCISVDVGLKLQRDYYELLKIYERYLL